MSYEELQKRAKAYALAQGWTEEEWENPELRAVVSGVSVVEEIEEWNGTCICDPDLPEDTQPDFGHHNQAGGYCCPHHGNTCGHCYEYDRRRVR